MEALRRRRARRRRMARAAMVVACAASVLAGCRQRPGQPTAPVPVRATPVPTPPANADALDCPTATSCFLVAAFAWSDLYHWDGSSWSRLPIDEPAPTPWPVSALSCPTATVCFLVRTSPDDSRLRFERWDGSTLTVIAPDFDDQGIVAALSCASDTWCMVSQGERQWVWDGVALRAVAAAPDLLVTAMSCATPTMCMGWSLIVAIVAHGDRPSAVRSAVTCG